MLSLDLRHALRSLGRSPGFSVVAVLSLALAIGLTTTAFVVVDAVRHPHVPYRDVDRLVQPRLRSDLPGANAGLRGLEVHDALREGTTVFESLAAASLRFGPLEGSAGEMNAEITTVDAGFFHVLGARPLLGRTFAPATIAEDAGGVVVSERVWRRLLGGGSTLGRATLVVDGQPRTVIGVMPHGVTFPFETDAWLPAPGGRIAERGPRTWIISVGRLRDDAAPERVRAELATVAARIVADQRVDPLANLRFVQDSTRPMPGRLNALHLALAGAAVAVLLIACANLANLMLARGTARRRELALRLSLGASRGMLVRHLLAEGVVLAIIGGALGLVAAAWGTSLLVHLVPAEVPLFGRLAPHLGVRAFAAALGAAALTVVLAALLPALRVSDVDVAGPLKDGAGTTTDRGRRRYGVLVVAQMALSLALLVAAMGLARAAARVTSFDFGYDARSLLATRVWLPRSEVADSTVAALRLVELLGRTRQVHGVQSAALLGYRGIDHAHVEADHAAPALGRAHVNAALTVSPDFLRTLGIPMVRGRDLTAGDVGTAVAVIDQRAARTLWGEEDPIGRMLSLGDPAEGGAWVRVIGVARDAELGFRADPYLEPEPAIYLPQSSGPSAQLVVRVEAGAEQQAGIVLRQVVTLAPGMRSTAVLPWLARFDGVVASHRFVAGVFVLLGVVALALATVGLYAVLAYAVSRRTREFGVRLALGARRQDVLVQVLREGMVLVLGGVAAGALLSLWTSQLLEAWFYDLPPADIAALAAAEAALALVALLASLAPAVRASRANPVDVLRAV